MNDRNNDERLIIPAKILAPAKVDFTGDAPVLELSHITKRFGGLTAVGDVSFQVEQGQIYGLIGPNGAGKTTIFNLITGVYHLSEGTILYYGQPLTAGEALLVPDPEAQDGLRRLPRRPCSLKPYEIANLGITRTFQNIRLFRRLTAYQNVFTACHNDADYNLIQPLWRWKVGPEWLSKFARQEEMLHAKAEELLRLMDLWQYRDMVASNLPYGLQRKLEIARALALNPRLLLLDEPAAGMNPEETLRLLELIKEIRDRFNLTVLVIEHHMDLIMNVCERIFVLNFGKPLAEGTPAEIQDNHEVVEAYLGKGDEDHADA